ncbi:DUF2914 domain-containing protein [Lujinxingia sediminis]|uniref:DUF2914 domain-containing protein n=1 Tax=Lujinxingia sediminis TaxID=2480984 RepID=A0ABY0CVD9_9DELT|nr:DUF2914 domain-containing protein [Lujinxingia sediminis]
MNEVNEGEGNPQGPVGASAPAGPLGVVRQALQSDAVQRWAPMSLFVGGFGIDAWTLGREVDLRALALVCVYVLLIPVCFAVLGRATHDKVLKGASLALHFALGALFSALVVLYFRSAGQLITMLIVMVLFGFMVWNEFSSRARQQFELLWGIYGVSAVMLLNFLLPYALGSVRALWFYLSLVLGMGWVLGARRMLGARGWRTLVPTVSFALVLAVLYPLGLIPPVPLVQEGAVVGLNFEKTRGSYQVLGERPTLLERVGLRERVVSRAEGEPVTVVVAVSAPSRATANLEHRWRRRTEEGWVTTDRIPITIYGGRDEGWRFYSRKKNIPDGLWRVETALKGGAVLGYETFEVRAISEEERAALELLPRAL